MVGKFTGPIAQLQEILRCYDQAGQMLGNLCLEEHTFTMDELKELVVMTRDVTELKEFIIRVALRMAQLDPTSVGVDRASIRAGIEKQIRSQGEASEAAIDRVTDREVMRLFKDQLRGVVTLDVGAQKRR